MHIQKPAIAPSLAASNPLATSCPLDDSFPHLGIAANLRAKHRSSCRAIASKGRVVNARTVVERIVHRAEWAGLDPCQVHNARPTPQSVGDHVCGGRSVVLEPQRRAGPVHRVVLGDIPHQVLPVKVRADFALPQPDRHQGISRNEGCEDDRCSVPLNHQAVRVAMHQIALNDEAQGALPVVIAQPRTQLCRCVLTLPWIPTFAPPADANSHLQVLAVRRSRDDELLSCSAHHLAFVLKNLESALGQKRCDGVASHCLCSKAVGTSERTCFRCHVVPELLPHRLAWRRVRNSRAPEMFLARLQAARNGITFMPVASASTRSARYCNALFRSAANSMWL